MFGSSLIAAEIQHSLRALAAFPSIPGTGGCPCVGKAAFRIDVSGRFARVRELPAADGQTIVCPHCKKTFVGELLSRGSRHEGFKCPHCRLFVPVERANAGAAAQR